MHLWIPGSKHKNGKPHAAPLSVLRKLRGRHATRAFTFQGETVVQVSTLAWRKARLERRLLGVETASPERQQLSEHLGAGRHRGFSLARSSAHVRDLAPPRRH